MRTAAISTLCIHFQVQSCQQSDQIGSPRITGAIQGISTIIREQGWKRLFAGLSLNYFKFLVKAGQRSRSPCQRNNLVKAAMRLFKTAIAHHVVCEIHA
ncbi:hypothetical protein KSP40_PGU011889 [Platanthera guangdongensis]|uniref:Transposase n=1 Tax=Platanthera guangdongensis TaxID=2320717 RepID=A0ABR2N3F1_9ASPA